MDATMAKKSGAMKVSETLVGEVEGVAPKTEGYRFVVREVRSLDGTGFQVIARGERGETVATVHGPVTAQTVIGAVFYR